MCGQHLFYRYWCLKESYIKAVGVGLGLEGGLLRLAFVSDPTLSATQPGFVVGQRAKFTMDQRLQADWRVEQSYLDSEHCTAVITGPFAAATPDFQSSLPVSAAALDFARAPLGPAELSNCQFEMLSSQNLLELVPTPASLVDDNYWVRYTEKREKKHRT